MWCLILTSVLGYVGNGSGRKRGHDGGDGNAKGKKPWRADRAHDGAGPSSGGSGGRAVFIPRDEMAARYSAGVCQFCGVAGHQRKDCRNPKSLTPRFAKQGQNGSS